MTASHMQNPNVVPLIAGASVVANNLVRNVAGLMQKTTLATQRAVGVALNSAAVGERVNVQLVGEVTLRAEAGVAIAQGDVLKPSAVTLGAVTGAVAAPGNVVIGTALTATTVPGSELQVLLQSADTIV